MFKAGDLRKSMSSTREATPFSPIPNYRGGNGIVQTVSNCYFRITLRVLMFWLLHIERIFARLWGSLTGSVTASVNENLALVATN